MSRGSGLIAGTPDFRVALIETLRERIPTGEGGTVEFGEGEWVSRNTVIYRGRIGTQRVVAKAHVTKPASVLAVEHDMMRSMEGVLADGMVRGLRPMAMLDELGVLVTEEEEGKSLRELIEDACRRPNEAWRNAVQGVDAAADGLRAFHQAFAPTSGVGESATQDVRWYLDFSPKNILVRPSIARQRPELILMDPPEVERWGNPAEDIGVFCFGVARVRFLPRFVANPSVRRITDLLKAAFIRRYFGPTESAMSTALKQIEAAEGRRALQAIYWYARPWRYPSMAKEVLRLAYLGPLTAVYRSAGLHRSHRRIESILQRSEEWWEKFPQRAPIGSSSSIGARNTRPSEHPDAQSSR